MKRGLIFIMILILPVGNTLYSQKAAKRFNITGKVTDISGAPISGAVILIDNQKTDVMTDSKGMYRIRVKADAKTIAVFKIMNGLGEEEINGRMEINFSLSGNTANQKINTDEESDDAVNVGYGNVSQKELNTSIGKIDGQNKKYASYQNIYDMIKGEVPGVQVSGNRITIQGITSINAGTEPLLVVNGIVVTSIDDINPQMVKSIEILKGSAASIYGSRGANGVVLITLTGAEKK